MKLKSIYAVIAIFISAVIFTNLFTLFVIQPIGAIPEGKTLLISRLNKTNFVDSADAMCERIQDGVSLLCRVMILGKITETSTIYLRLPYMEWLYLLSTNGKKYDK